MSRHTVKVCYKSADGCSVVIRIFAASVVVSRGQSQLLEFIYKYKHIMLYIFHCTFFKIFFIKIKIIGQVTEINLIVMPCFTNNSYSVEILKRKNVSFHISFLILVLQDKAWCHRALVSITAALLLWPKGLWVCVFRVSEQRIFKLILK